MPNATVRSFPADPRQLGEVRAFLRKAAEHAFFSHEAAEELVLAATEAATNAIQHAGATEIRVGWTQADGSVEVVVEDDGTFRRRVAALEGWEGSGRGIPLMIASVDEFSIRHGEPGSPGTVVRLVKRDEPVLDGGSSPA